VRVLNRNFAGRCPVSLVNGGDGYSPRVINSSDRSLFLATSHYSILREIRLVGDDQVRPAESQLVAAAGPETDNVLNHVPVVHV